MSRVRKTPVFWGIALAFVFQNILAGADDDGSLTHAAPYVAESPLSGEIQIVGTEAMQQLAVLWKRGFLGEQDGLRFPFALELLREDNESDRSR